MKRTQDEINRQIEGLKKDRKKLPQFSMFGDKNWEKIDAQISVLEGNGNPDFYYEDETAEEFEEGDNNIYHAAEEADEWLCGNRNEDLFDED
jgi:hypothetical protein